MENCETIAWVVGLLQHGLSLAVFLTLVWIVRLPPKYWQGLIVGVALLICLIPVAYFGSLMIHGEVTPAHCEQLGFWDS
jgi:beta-lactamase regulating signal transducer with metallopeptidase domain